MGSPKPDSSSFAWYSWMSMASARRSGEARRLLRIDRCGDLDDILGHAGGGGVDHAAVELHGAAPVGAGVVERPQDAPGAVHLGRRRGEDLVREGDLGRMNRPLPLVAERGRAPRRGE